MFVPQEVPCGGGKDPFVTYPAQPVVLVTPLMYAMPVPPNPTNQRAILLHDCIHWAQCDPKSFQLMSSFFSDNKTKLKQLTNSYLHESKIYAKFWAHAAAAAYHSEHLS